MTRTPKLTEKEVLLLLKQKNENVVAYLYDQYAAAIYGIIVREVESTKLASEILKNTFINITREGSNVDCVKLSLFTWLLALMKKTASNDFKVNINLKSLIPSEKVNGEHNAQTGISFVNKRGSAAYCFSRAM